MCAMAAAAAVFTCTEIFMLLSMKASGTLLHQQGRQLRLQLN
jgi:hypothetical protein